jgi:hypothetical protein
MLMTLTASCRRNSRPVRRSSPVVGRKVSDEFTVPLCGTHYRDNHRFGDEQAWWGRQAIDPLGTSRQLWVSTRRIQ